MFGKYVGFGCNGLDSDVKSCYERVIIIKNTLTTNKDQPLKNIGETLQQTGVWARFLEVASKELPFFVFDLVKTSSEFLIQPRVKEKNPSPAENGIELFSDVKITQSSQRLVKPQIITHHLPDDALEIVMATKCEDFITAVVKARISLPDDVLDRVLNFHAIIGNNSPLKAEYVQLLGAILDAGAVLSHSAAFIIGYSRQPVLQEKIQVRLRNVVEIVEADIFDHVTNNISSHSK